MNNMFSLLTTYLNLAYGALVRQRMRSILTMLAVSIGITAIVVILAAGKGLRHVVMGQLEAFGTDTISIEVKIPSARSNNDDGALRASGVTVTTLKNDDIAAVAKHPQALAAYGLVTSQEAVSYNGELRKIVLFGYGYAAPEVEKIPLTAGRFYARDEEESLATVAVLGATAKEKLFGGQTAVGQTISIHGHPFKVIGVVGKRGSSFFIDMDNVIYLPTKTLQKRLLGIDYVNNIIVKLKSNSNMSAVADDFTDTLRERHNITDPDRDDFTVHTMDEAQAKLGTIVDGITTLLIALVCVSLLVGGVGITNIMYVSVSERTFEIGLRKSLGATARDILAQFLCEAILLTLGGGVVGILFGIIISYLVYLAAMAGGLNWIFSVSFFSLFLSVTFSVAIGIFFGVYPAKQAAQLNPIDALRKE